MPAPKGSHNRAKAAMWADQLKWALENYEDLPRGIKRGLALREIAKGVVADAIDKASEHHWAAVQEIAVRLDGKPAQAVTLDGTGEGGEILIGEVRRLIVHANAGNSDSGGIPPAT